MTARPFWKAYRVTAPYVRLSTFWSKEGPANAFRGVSKSSNREISSVCSTSRFSVRKCNWPVSSAGSRFLSVSMSSSKPDVLAIGQPLPSLETELRELSVLHIWEPGNDERLKEILGECGERITAVATSSFKGFPSKLFPELPALKIISCFGVGTDSIDVNLAKQKGIAVTNTPDVLTEDVADLALALLLAVARRICEADRYVRDGKWPVHGMMPLTTKVSGKRVGIVGMGRIGCSIATRAAAFGCAISYQSRSKKPDLSSYYYYSSVVELASASDFLIIACPLTKETRHLIGRPVLDALGPGGILVNIARGPVVDEGELVKALVEGRLGGAGLDVFEKEPEVPSALFELPQVVLLPHVASGTHETRGEMGRVTAANLRAFFSGQPLLTPVG
eukprot:TRINITY_DN29594_c0_g1_i1.p1 TRINITY_DN29594_c0_g1~~TRINITY_DN29594_c0_g1_i1.p1  ORF type:complete len:392 (-),score=33.79 TRINITY_DN29594_c0_g1_i1:629-1804(-)